MKPEKKAIAMSEEAKGVLEILKDKSESLLNDLKTQSGLSNKKWDKTIKCLTKNKLASVNKTDVGLFVELVE